MSRSITVKGTGNVSMRPDLIIITMVLETKHLEYDRTMELAARSAEALQLAVEAAGSAREDLKTTNLNIRTEYESYHDQDNSYRTKFAGYVFEQDLTLEFQFDNSVVSNVLDAIAAAPVTPRLDIRFSVKDQEAVKEELLKKAADNAKAKAEILTRSAGVELGDLISIDYSWVDIGLYSQSSVAWEEKLTAARSAPFMDIEPENIEASDTVTFIWEIR